MQLATLVNRQFIKFLVVGGFNTVFGYSVFLALHLMGYHYAIAALGSNVLGVLFNFNTTGRIVFKNKNNFLIFGFIGVYVLTYLLNLLLLQFFQMINVDLKIAGALALLPMAVFTYFMQKTFVFRDNLALKEA